MANFIKTLGGGSALSDSGGDGWSNITNILIPDGNNAIASISKNDVSKWARSYNFNFSIESDATINGIVMRLTRAGESSLTDSQVYLQDTGRGQKGSNYAKGEAWSGLSTSTYGGSSDLWGASWTISDINNANFGVMIEASNDSNIGTRDAEIDYIEISIYYSRPDATPMMLNMGAF